MTKAATLIGPVGDLLDALVADPAARDAAKLALLKPEHGPALTRLGEAAALAADPWTERARPTFLYVMYALLLWAIPLGLVAALRPETAAAIARGMTAYLSGIPEPLYALFGTGYVGYTVARTWGKARGVR